MAEKLPRPPYFRHMEQVNLGGGRPLDATPGPLVLQPRELQKRMKEGVLIDTRSPEAFAGAHIHGAYNIWLDGLSSFGGWVANERTRIFLVVDQPDKAQQAIKALARIGIDSVEGVMFKGVEGWREQGLPIEELGTTSAQEAAEWLQAGDAQVLDVRDDMEWNEKHIPGALHTFVGYLEEKLPQVPEGRRGSWCTAASAIARDWRCSILKPPRLHARLQHARRHDGLGNAGAAAEQARVGLRRTGD